MKGNMVTRFEICLSDEQAETVGRIATEIGLTSDEVLRQSVASFALTHDRERQRLKRRCTVEKGMRIQDELRDQGSVWDVLAALRSLRERPFSD